MHDISELMHSPAFWFSTVIIGLVLSVIGTWLTRLIDRGWFVGRSVWSDRSKKAKEVRERRVRLLAISDAALAMRREHVASLRAMSLLMALCGLYLETDVLDHSAGPVRSMLDVLGLCCLVLSILVMLQASNRTSVISDAFLLRDAAELHAANEKPTG